MESLDNLVPPGTGAAATATAPSSRAPAPAPAPASRQKSCNACVKSKRKCDKRQPVCTRCAEKKYTCIYAKRAQPDPYPFMLALENSAQLAENMDFSFLDVMNAAPAPSQSHSSVSSADAFDIPVDPLLAMLGTPGQGQPASDMWLMQGQSQSQSQGRYAAAGSSTVAEGDYAQLDHLSYEPWQLYDANLRVLYVTNAVKAFHAVFAKESQTPFHHRHLYRDCMPQSILQCFTVSALFANRTVANRGIVSRSLQQNLAGLRDGSFSPLASLTPQEKLARTQALFLYQTIRLFDGDVHLRAQAEDDMPLLESWLADLCKSRDNLGDVCRMDESDVRANPPQSWEQWIFAESLRRTIVMAYAFMRFYQLLIGGSTDFTDGAGQCLHRWTLSRHLWEAPSSFEFFRQWRDKPLHIMSNFEFERLLKLGRQDHVDDFARVILTW